ncbi:SET domain-containing protein [Aureobasidium pullulans]|uniref:SET domain-containing protein n=1 Tax=Aureobasidium pullulans TaxID=5580 RepID=A0A4S9X7U6_AURPU|nr:SET domain-containing protein [Aureobasidium pullulans]
MVKRSLVDAICCHRVSEGKEQYLLRWKHDEPSQAILSWHDLEDLGSIADFLQIYVGNYVTSLKSGNSSLGVPVQVTSLKRKSPHDESPHDESSKSRASSQGTTISTSSVNYTAQKHEVYNGILQRKAGDIYPVYLTSARIPRLDATAVLTPEMLADAKAHLADGVKKARRFVRRQFLDQLLRIPGPPVTFVNDRNKETPSLSFTYIQDYVYGEGVSRTDADAVMLGCGKYCRPDMGSNRGCEYTKRCECLEYATPDFRGLSKEEQKAHYEAWQAGELDAAELPKRFPYRLDNDQRTGIKQYVLDGFYLESRNVLYECNPKCRCGPKCKNRLVQKGRTVSLEIFKTTQRGFGLRCPVNLRRGQYIDRYLGELITDHEADAREASSGRDKASYLFWLDKFANDDGPPGSLRTNDCYVADGEKMGGPTRFINHSCDPNCRLFTVSYNRDDQKIYDLAFFALEDIPAGTELTFDYMDPEEGEAGQAVHEEMDEGTVAVDCLCGAKNCRGKLWM